MVLIIIVLIAALGIPAMRGTLAQRELTYSADTLRAAWLDTQVRAMEDAQIFCMRAQIGGSKLRIDRILDTHFTAYLSSRQTTGRYDTSGEYDPFERGGFTGDSQDFLLAHPDDTAERAGTEIIELPSTVVVADVISVAEERAAFYLGYTAQQGAEEDEIYAVEEIMTGEIRLGEMSSAEGIAWSTPIFFYPDGSTSTAAVLLKNESGRCIEVRLRGLTGKGTVTETVRTIQYSGEMDANRF